jgi:ferredoxin
VPPSVARPAFREVRQVSPTNHYFNSVAAQRLGFQANLEVGRRNDPLEREADQVAERVLDADDTAAVEHARTCSCGGSCPACRRAATLERSSPSRKIVHALETTPSQPATRSSRVPGKRL